MRRLHGSRTYRPEWLPFCVAVAVLLGLGAIWARSARRRSPVSQALGLALVAAAILVLGETRLGLGRYVEGESGLEELAALLLHPPPVLAAALATAVLLAAARIAGRAKLSTPFEVCALFTASRALRGGIELHLAAATLRGERGGVEWIWVLADLLDWGAVLAAVLLVWIRLERTRAQGRRIALVLAALAPLALSLMLLPFDLAGMFGSIHRARAARVRALLAATGVEPASDSSARFLLPPRIAVVDASDSVHLLDEDRTVSIPAGEALPDGDFVFVLDKAAPSAQLERVARRVAKGEIALGLIREDASLGRTATRFAIADDRSFAIRLLRILRPSDPIPLLTPTEAGFEETHCPELRAHAGLLIEQLEDAHCLVGPPPARLQPATTLRWREAAAERRYRASIPRPIGTSLLVAGVLGAAFMFAGRHRFGLAPLLPAFAMLVGTGLAALASAIVLLALP